MILPYEDWIKVTVYIDLKLETYYGCASVIFHEDRWWLLLPSWKDADIAPISEELKNLLVKELSNA